MKDSKTVDEITKVDHAEGFLALDWLQWGDEFDEQKAQIALRYMSKLKAENEQLTSKVNELRKGVKLLEKLFERENLKADSLQTQLDSANVKLQRCLECIANIRDASYIWLKGQSEVKLRNIHEWAKEALNFVSGEVKK